MAGRVLRIDLRREMYDELADAALRTAKSDEQPCSPEEFALQLIESELANRRLERIARASRSVAIQRCSSLGCCSASLSH
jgi:hypothetical protein